MGLLGLTFKPNTDDLRDAPALELIEQLTRLGAKVKAYDPLLDTIELHPVLAKVTLASTPVDLATDCDALILVTDWQEFRTLDFCQLAWVMNGTLIIDGRNFLDAQLLADAGFCYIGIGCPMVSQPIPGRLSTPESQQLKAAA